MFRFTSREIKDAILNNYEGYSDNI